MIVQVELNRRIDEILSGPIPPMQVLSLGPEVAGTEQHITLCRGNKKDFTDAIHFWLKARQCSEWWDIWGDGNGFGNKYEDYWFYAAKSIKAEEPLQYSPLLKDEFYEFIDTFPHFVKLSQPLSKELGLDTIKEMYIAGVTSTVSDYIGSAALAEFQHDFVAFHWQSTG